MSIRTIIVGDVTISLGSLLSQEELNRIDIEVRIKAREAEPAQNAAAARMMRERTNGEKAKDALVGMAAGCALEPPAEPVDPDCEAEGRGQFTSATLVDWKPSAIERLASLAATMATLNQHAFRVPKLQQAIEVLSAQVLREAQEDQPEGTEPEPATKAMASTKGPLSRLSGAAIAGRGIGERIMGSEGVYEGTSLGAIRGPRFVRLKFSDPTNPHDSFTYRAQDGGTPLTIDMDGLKRLTGHMATLTVTLDG